MLWVGLELEVYYFYFQALAAVNHLGTYKHKVICYNRLGIARSPNYMALYFSCLLFLGLYCPWEVIASHFTLLAYSSFF